MDRKSINNTIMFPSQRTNSLHDLETYSVYTKRNEQDEMVVVRRVGFRRGAGTLVATFYPSH
jgi:hypothetical protein